MTKASEAAMRAAESIDNVFYDSEPTPYAISKAQRELIAELIDAEYASAIEALRQIAADDADDNPWEFVAQDALEKLGIPLDEE